MVKNRLDYIRQASKLHYANYFVMNPGILLSLPSNAYQVPSSLFLLAPVNFCTNFSPQICGNLACFQLRAHESNASAGEESPTTFKNLMFLNRGSFEETVRGVSNLCMVYNTSNHTVK